MSYEKLPFKEYTVMSNNLIQKLGCADVYRTYVLLLIADKYTLTTDTTIDELASFVGDKPANYKGGKSSKSFNDKLRATGEVSIQNKDSGRNSKPANLLHDNSQRRNPGDEIKAEDCFKVKFKVRR